MKKFNILRYLKQFSALIFVLALAGAVAIYFFGKSQQSYVASAVIQYTNTGAKNGYTPDGSPLNVEEIYSSNVIDAALTDLGYQTNIDSIRSNCYVEEVIPEAQQLLNAALLEKGEDPSYVTDTYRVYYICSEDNGEEYAWNVLDAIIKNYCEFYAEKYVEEQLQNNGVSALSEGTYDYIESAEVLDASVSEMLDYLLSKRTAHPHFRSVETGYTYDDLYRIYYFLYNYEIPSLYAAILSNAEAENIDLLMSRLTMECEDIQLDIENRKERADYLKSLIDTYTGGNRDIMDYHYNISSSGSESTASIITSSEHILKMVEGNHDASNTETTYDTLIQQYVKLNIEVHQQTLEKEHKEYLLSVFRSALGTGKQKSHSTEEIREKLEHCVDLANEYYRYVENTGHELNRYLSANYLSMLSSISVQPTVNVKLYLVIAVVLFVLVGCVGSVLLGRALDFIDYFRYVDKTVQLPNRARCDAFIDERSAKLLDENFSIVSLRMDSLSRLSSEFGRTVGDEVLKDFAMILKSFGDLYGFVGYNGSGVFYAFFPDCSPEKLNVILEAIGRQVEQYNNQKPEHGIRYTIGKAVSSTERVYEIRTLLRLAIRRMNEGKAAPAPVQNAAEAPKAAAGTESTEKQSDKHSDKQ